MSTVVFVPPFTFFDFFFSPLSSGNMTFAEPTEGEKSISLCQFLTQH